MRTVRLGYSVYRCPGCCQQPLDHTPVVLSSTSTWDSYHASFDEVFPRCLPCARGGGGSVTTRFFPISADMSSGQGAHAHGCWGQSRTGLARNISSYIQTYLGGLSHNTRHNPMWWSSVYLIILWLFSPVGYLLDPGAGGGGEFNKSISLFQFRPEF